MVLALVAVASTAGAGVAHKRVKPTPGTVIATDDFADPKATGWLLVDQADSGSTAVDGKIAVEVRVEHQGHRVFGTKPDPLPAAYALEVDAVRESGDKTAVWGLLCRAGADSQYEFLLGARFAGIWRSAKGQADRIDENDKAELARFEKAYKPKVGATNRIRGECLEGSRFRLFVNGRFVAEATDPDPLPVASSWGLFAGSNALRQKVDVTFDDFELFELQP
jgi:hypothetical protein